MPFTSKCSWWSTLTIVSTAACVCLIYTYLASKEKHPENTSYQKLISAPEKLIKDDKFVPICNTNECVLFAKYLHKFVKPEANPCENAYTFTCGNFVERFAEDEAMNINLEAESRMYKILNNIIKDTQADPESAVGKMKTMYDSCMNYVNTEKYALLTAQNFLKDIGIPDWPHLPEDFQFLNTDIPNLLGNLIVKGEVLFFYFLSYNFTFYEKEYLYIGVDGRYFNKLLKPPSKKSVTHILKYFKLDSEAIELIWNDYNAVRDSVLKLQEENCGDLSLDCQNIGTDDVLDWLYRSNGNKCTQLSLNCSIRWDFWADLCKTFKVFFKDSGLSSGRFYDDFLKIVAGDNHFVYVVFTVLKSFPERAVANYFALNFYLEHLGELNFYFQRTKERYISGTRCEPQTPKPIMDRWEVCTQWITKMMSFPLQFEFHKKYFPLEEIEKISGLFEECMSDEIDAVSRQEWIPEEDKKRLSDLIKKGRFNMNWLAEGVSQQKLYERELNDIYKSFHPTGKSFLHNVLEFRKTISDIFKMTSSIFIMQGYSFEVQAYSSYGFWPEYVIQFGLLIPPYYVPKLDRVINVVLFATIMGHEIGHSVDYYSGFIGNETLRRVDEIKDCLTNQYSDFKLEFSGDMLNGSQYVDENFADIAFAEMVDRFIAKYVSLEENILLPGFPYSSKQLLYIAENMRWCSKSVENEEVFFKEMETHSPHKIRLIGTMRNSRGFSEAFNCSEGSYMNPALKCRIML